MQLNLQIQELYDIVYLHCSLDMSTCSSVVKVLLAFAMWLG